MSKRPQPRPGQPAWLSLTLIIFILLNACSLPFGPTPTPAPTATPTHPAVDPALTATVDMPEQLSHFKPNQAVTVRFSQAMNPASADLPVLTYPYVNGRFTWDSTHTQVTFTPLDRFEPGQSYTLGVNRALLSAQNRAFASLPQWSLQTLAGPSVLNHVPAEARLAEAQPAIYLLFDRAMDPASVAAALTVEPSVPVSIDWQDYTAVIHLQQPLTAGRRYRFTLARTATDSAGLPLSDDYIWSYWLPGLELSLTRLGPEANAPLGLYTNSKLDRQSFAQNIQVEPPLAGQWKWQDETPVFYPATYLPAPLTYTFSFSADLVDTAGRPIAAPAPFEYVTPWPVTVNMETASTATEHKLSLWQGQPDPLKITFDRPVDKDTVPAALRLTPAVTSTLRWEDNALLVHPANQSLQPDTVYTLTVETSLKDAQGQAFMQAPFVYRFTVSEKSTLPNGSAAALTFGQGPNVQVLDVNGPQVVFFASDAHQTFPVDFALYPIDYQQFLELYTSNFRGVLGTEAKPFRFAATIPSATWQNQSNAELVTPPPDYSRWPENYTVYQVVKTSLPAGTPPGIYVIKMSGQGATDHLLVVLSRYTLTLKEAEGQITVWATDINGQSAAGLAVEVYTRTGQSLAQCQTDARGLCQVRVSQNPAPLMVVARAGNELTVAGLNNEWRSNGSAGWWTTTPQAPTYAAYVYTERPIYRPGQLVYFKAILRAEADAALSLPPAGTPVTLTVRDARNNVVQTLALATNAMGSVNGQFQIAAGAMTGNYAVEASVGESRFRKIFKVQDYRKPDYQVAVTPAGARYVVSDTIQVTTSANYYFGQPLAQAPVTVKFYMLAQDWRNSDADEPSFTWYVSNEMADLQAFTDAEGRYTFSLPAKLAYQTDYDWQAQTEYTTWGIEATFDDGSQNPVSAFATVRVYANAAKLQLDTGGWLHAPNQPFTLKASALTIQDQPLANQALQVNLYRYNEQNYKYDQTAQTIPLTTNANGQAQAELTVTEPDHYKVVLSSRDRLGNLVEYERWLYIYSGTGRWSGRSNNSLKITADHDTYAPGDTARLVIESPVTGPALLTFECGQVRREMPVQLTDRLTVVEVPVLESDIPNIFVTVNVWQPQDTQPVHSQYAWEAYQTKADSRLRVASTELAVPATARVLTVTITPDKNQYRPREQATFTVRVTDAAGQPVPAAEVSLALVDEAIFGLSQDLSGPLYDGFYYKRQNVVRTYDSLRPQRSFPVFAGGRGGGGGDGNLSLNPRSDFPDTAAWYPNLTTDANGEVKVSLSLPDSLTTWRLTAKVHTALTYIGDAYTTFLTQQPVVVRPILPRALTAGDDAQLTAIVHNYTDAPQVFTVTLAATAGLEITAPGPQSLTLAPQARGLLQWLTHAAQAGAITVTVTANAGPAGGDAVQLPLTVNPLAVPDYVNASGEFTATLNTTAYLPADALPQSQLKVELNRTVAGSLLTGLEFLTGFPYGCVEQTMSRALPNAVVGRAFNQLGVGQPTLAADLPPRIQASLQRLYGYQHDNGGWGWWYDDDTDAYQTAWVIFGLAMTQDAGYTVDPGVISRGAQWLNNHLGEMDIRTRAFALYSLTLAQQGNLGETRALLAHLYELDPFSQAALALALHNLGRSDEARQVLNALTDSAVKEDNLVFWPTGQEDGHYHEKTMASAIRSTALALEAFTRIQPGSALENGSVQWLMSRRKQSGWGSTNETSFSILALTDHLLATAAGTADTAYTVLLNNRRVAAGTLGRGEPVVTLEIPAAQLEPGINLLTVTQTGSARLYYNVTTQAYVPHAQIEASGNITVTRLYLDPLTDVPLETAQPGQLVKTQLIVDLPAEGAYMLIEDHLPGGLEALNEKLNTTSHEGNVYSRPVSWRDYGYNNKEIYGDRVTFFVTEMAAGVRTFTYLARATREGRFVAMPVEVSAMYNAALWGRSASAAFSVSPDALPPARPTATPAPTATPTPLSATLHGHTGWLSSVAFHPKQYWLATGSDDGTVRLWDIASQSTLRTFTGPAGSVLGVAFNPDGQRLAAAGKDKLVWVWDTNTGEAVFKLEGHAAAVWSVAYSPGGQWLASASEDGEVRLWNASTGEYVRSLKPAETEEVWNISFSPDGRALAVAGKAVRVWDVNTGEILRQLEVALLPQGASMAVFSPDGQELLTAGQNLELWNATTGKLQRLFVGHTGWVWAAAFSPDGTKLVSGSKDQTLRLWEASSGTLLQTYTEAGGSINAVAYSADGQAVASASTDMAARVYRP